MRSCSTVLDAIINESSEPKTLQMEDVSEKNVETFLSLAGMTSYDSAKPYLSAKELSSMTALAMPLVHKYDCIGLLKILKSVQNDNPDVAGIRAIVQCEQGDVDWLGDTAKSHLVHDAFGKLDKWMPFPYLTFAPTMEKRQKTTAQKNPYEEYLLEMPPTLVATLFAHTMRNHRTLLPK